MGTESQRDGRRTLSRLARVFILLTIFGLLGPLILSLSPSDKADALGQPISIEIDNLTDYQPIIVEWRGHRNYIIVRSKEEIEGLKRSYVFGYFPIEIGPAYDPNLRSIRDDIFVVTAICPHRSCQIELAFVADFDSLDFEYDGDRILWDPCHGWFFDLAGRYIGQSDFQPIPTTGYSPQIRALPVPDYRFIGEQIIELGRQ